MSWALRPKFRFTCPLTTTEDAHTATPVSAPPVAPPRMAAEITALQAHSVVGQDWLSAIQGADAT